METLIHPSALTAGHFLADARCAGPAKSNQKRLRSTIRPSAALRVPSRRRLPGPRGLRFAAQIYISRLRLRRRVLPHLALQAPLLSLLKSRICGAWNCAHEDQEQRIATLSQKPRPRPRSEFFFCVVCSGLFAGQARSHDTAPLLVGGDSWERACPAMASNYPPHLPLSPDNASPGAATNFATSGGRA